MISFKAFLRKIFAGGGKKDKDGQDQWSSRTSYILASMGGAISFGNLLRFPSVVFNNNGLQFFIPYILAITMLAIPVVILEVSIGQAYRSGATIAYNSVYKRARGVGLGMVMVVFTVCCYFVPLLAWTMKYFRASFQSPLPWRDRFEYFYYLEVLQAPDPVPGSYNADGTVETYASYQNIGFLGETAAWTAFSWFVVWICIYKGVAVTGKVVYFSMGLPIIVTIILVGHGASLPNAGRGIKLYFAEFHGQKLASGQIWQAAIGQVFYSTGVGFGYYSAYASYTSQFANAVQDAVIICCCNASFEVFAAFCAFGVIGYIGLTPETSAGIGSYTLEFLTFPVALSEMPAANFWAVLFFFVLFLLGMSSSFVMIDALITAICDTDRGRKHSHVLISTSVVVVSFLISLIYCTEFGFHLLNAIDAWINYVAVLFVVFSECVTATVLYRYAEVVGQVGLPAFHLYNAGYIGGMVFCPAVAQTVSPGAGAGTGFGIYVAGVVASVLLARDPDSTAPRFWGRSNILNRFWWMAFYSGNQLRRDLNITVAKGKNWDIPVAWGVILRYVSASTLAIILSFSYPAFYPVRYDPLEIFGFIVGHLIMFLVILAFLVPRVLNVWIPVARREEGKGAYAPQVSCGAEDSLVGTGVETGQVDPDSSSSTYAGIGEVKEEERKDEGLR